MFAKLFKQTAFSKILLKYMVAESVAGGREKVIHTECQGCKFFGYYICVTVLPVLIQVLAKHFVGG